MTLTTSRRGSEHSHALAASAAIGVCAIGAFAIAFLWPALSTVPYWDDLYSLIAIDVAASRGRPAVAVTGDLMGFWRPIELMLIDVSRHIDPVGYLPVKLVSFALHAAKALAVAFLVRRLTPRLPASVPLAAGLVALAHPIAVSAIIQIDTVSEAAAAAAIAWALYCTLDAVTVTGPARRMRMIQVAVLSGLALLGKESALPAVAALPFAGLIAARNRKEVLPALARLTIALALICVVFLAVRYGLGFWRPQTGDDRYQIGVGFNVLRNIATVAGSLSFFGSTVSLVADHRTSAAIGFAPIIVAICLVARAALWRRAGLVAAVDGRAVLACVLMALAAVSAPSLAPAISEHNADLPSAAFLSVAMAITAAAAWVCGRTAMRLLAATALMAVVLGLAAMKEKAAASAQVGAAVADVRRNISTVLQSRDGVTVCIAPGEGRAYSIYRLPAERWLGEELLWARHLFPGKTISQHSAGPGCDIVTPNFPVMRTS